MKNLSRGLVYVKATLFLIAAAISATLLVADHPNVRTVVLLAIVCWASARFYYFCFYVIERYVDPSFRFSGIGSVAAYLLRGRRKS